MLVPFEFLKDLGRTIDEWGWNSIVTYVQLHDKAVIEQVNQKITDLRHRKVLETLQDKPEDLEQFTKRRKTEFMLRPLVDIHLHSYGGYNRSMGFYSLYLYCVGFDKEHLLYIPLRGIAVSLRSLDSCFH